MTARTFTVIVYLCCLYGIVTMTPNVKQFKMNSGHDIPMVGCEFKLMKINTTLLDKVNFSGNLRHYW